MHAMVEFDVMCRQDAQMLVASNTRPLVACLSFCVRNAINFYMHQKLFIKTIYRVSLVQHNYVELPIVQFAHKKICSALDAEKF